MLVLLFLLLFDVAVGEGGVSVGVGNHGCNGAGGSDGGGSCVRSYGGVGSTGYS